MASFAFLVLSAITRADTVYTYTGPAPADLSGWFETSAPLAPQGNIGFGLNAVMNVGLVAFDFTDGVDVWTSENGSSFGGGVFVNPDGTFLDWNFAVGNAMSEGISITNLGGFYYQDITPLGDTFTGLVQAGPKGSWTISTVPEPVTAILLLPTLFGLLMVRSRKRYGNFMKIIFGNDIRRLFA